MHRLFYELKAFKLHWDAVGEFLLITFFILTAAAVKVGYHNNRLCTHHIPESGALLLLGIVTGLIINFHNLEVYMPTFSYRLFTYFLLPPIIMDSSFELHSSIFLNNIGSIMLFAVIGTILNIILLSPSLYGCHQLGFFKAKTMSFIEIVLFSTIISAVDPVAVLAVFQEVNINKSLYYLVFGESILNDAAVITLYHRIQEFSQRSFIKPTDIIFSLLSFLITIGGAFTVGLIYGILSTIATRFTSHRKLRIVEPLILLTTSYSAYLTAELFQFSGIISVVLCGILQAEYAKFNISRKSETTMKHLTKIVSSVSETIIFLFLGLTLVDTNHTWDTSFVVFCSFFIILYRFIIVFALSHIANEYFQRIRIVNFEEKVLIAYGGLRGAIAFSLINILNTSENYHEISNLPLFTTTTLFVILFTVLVLGSTTEPIVKLLRVKLQARYEFRNFDELNRKVMRIIMQGVEAIAGQRNWLGKTIDYSDKYLTKLLVRKPIKSTVAMLASYDEIKSSRLKKAKPAPFQLSMLDAPEKNIFPDLTRRIDVSEFLDSQGKFLPPILDQHLIEEEEAAEESLSIHSINRVVKISKDFALFNYIVSSSKPESSITTSKYNKETKTGSFSCQGQSQI